MSGLLREIRLAVRGLLKARGFTTIALLALSLSVGANTAMFSITRAVLLQPLPYPNPEALVKVSTVLLDSGTPIVSAPPDFYAVREGQRSFTQVGAWYGRPVVLTGRDQPERLRAGILSAELLPILGVGPVLGRGFDRDDEVWGSHRKVILSDGLWHARFAGDPGILGRTLSLNGEPHLIVGVLPPGFTWIDGEAQLFLPMAFEPGDNMNTHNNYFL